MKQLVFTFALLFVGLSHAQNIFDGLRYSQDRTLGSARFAAMGGTFGALGGETAAIGSNPAASSVFIRNRSDITLSVYGRENSSTYFG
ncbi:MAG: transporter, partial [Marinirhabdus sp.]